jgi:AcrR family transcriptional regulator
MSTTKEATRLRLLAAARTLLLERGFHRVALDDIAEAAGVSRQAVYKSHYASKAELVLDLVRHVHVSDHLDELIAPIHEAASGPAMLEQTVVALVRIEERLHELTMALIAAADSDAGAAAAWRDRRAVKQRELHAALSRVKAEGQLRPTWKVEEAVDVLGALTSPDTYQLLVVEGGWKPAALIRKIWDLCGDSLLLAPARPASRPRRQR